MLFRRLDPHGGLAESGHITAEDLLGPAASTIEALVGTRKAFCRGSRAVVTGEAPILLTPDRVVIEVGEAIVDDDAGRAGCRRLVERGYTLAIDDFRGTAGADELLELGSIVKIDSEARDREQLREMVETAGRCGVEVIARNVDSPAGLELCESLGIERFQGYLLARPHTTGGGPLAPGRLAGLRMSARLLDAECPVAEIEDIIRGDPAMSHQLLQLAGIGVAGGMRRTVTTIRQAVVLVGWRRLQSWVALLLLTDKGTASEEEIAAVLMRARMSELLATEAGCRPDAGYTAGLLSALDVVLGMPIDRIVETLPLDTELRDAVLRGEGPLGRLVADVADYQLGRPESAVRSSIAEHTLRSVAVEALMWTVGMTAVLEPGVRA